MTKDDKFITKKVSSLSYHNLKFVIKVLVNKKIKKLVWLNIPLVTLISSVYRKTLTKNILTCD